MNQRLIGGEVHALESRLIARELNALMPFKFSLNFAKTCVYLVQEKNEKIFEENAKKATLLFRQNSGIGLLPRPFFIIINLFNDFRLAAFSDCINQAAN